MKNRPLTQALALLLTFLLASPLFSPLSAASPATALGRVVASSPAAVNGVAIPQEVTVFSGDRLATGSQGWARLFLTEGEQIHLGSRGEARAQRAGERVAIELLRGRLTLRTGSKVNVRSNGLEIVPRATASAVWEVARLSETVTLVSAHQGTLEVRAANRTVEVAAGRSLRIDTALAPRLAAPQGPAAGAGLSPTARRAIIAAVLAALITTSVIVTKAAWDNAPESPAGI